jgi:ABC-2 type transport system ATP-binding protein
MARIRLTPDLGCDVRFSGVGVRLPTRQRRGGGGRRQQLRRFAGEVRRVEDWYLREASFEVQPGESLAIVGHRGSGKEELLRLAAGTLIPDEGRVDRRGPVIPMVGLRAALNRGYTVRQNIYLVGGLLGLTVEESGRRLAEVVELAGVEKVLDKYLGDTPSTVRGRLAWAIAMSVHGRAYAIAQSLIVGDVGFHARCWETVEGMKADGVTFLVSADKSSELERFCDRALVLDRGRIIAQTSVAEALELLKTLPPPKDQARRFDEEPVDPDDDDLM